MKLRIVAGNLKGRMVTLPATSQRFRPTLERHRESILQILTPSLAGARAADLCAGSGVVGFEMLSRGAVSVDFVETDRGRAQLIRRHASAFGVEQHCHVHCTPVQRFLDGRAQCFDVVFFDPPYADNELAELAGAIFPLLTPGGVLVYEHARERVVSRLAPPAEVARQQTRPYGGTAIELIVKAS